MLPRLDLRRSTKQWRRRTVLYPWRRLLHHYRYWHPMLDGLRLLLRLLRRRHVSSELHTVLRWQGLRRRRRMRQRLSIWYMF